jgi:hypothetical protein
MGAEVFVLFLLIVIAVVAGAVVYAVRGGLWARETDPDAKEPSDERPEHLEVHDEAKERFIAPER